MCRFLKNFFKVALGLTSAMLLIIAPQAQVATGEVIKPGGVFLVQNTEPAKEKQPCPVPPPQEQKKLKTMGPQMERMERSVPRSVIIRDEPEKAGTKKIGGQAIRAKETPGGE